jgi:hypothetical protein
MDPNNVGNNISDISSGSISISQPSTTATPSSLRRTNYSSITTDTRRSVRLSAKSPKKTSLSSDQSTLHRTISGGVGNTHSPKLNVCKRTSGSTDTQGISTSSISYSTITFKDNVGIRDNNNNNSTSYRNLLPSDQSDDDDEILTNNSVIVKKKQPD